jgi:hypothetical protein
MFGGNFHVCLSPQGEILITPGFAGQESDSSDDDPQYKQPCGHCERPLAKDVGIYIFHQPDDKDAEIVLCIAPLPSAFLCDTLCTCTAPFFLQLVCDARIAASDSVCAGDWCSQINRDEMIEAFWVSDRSPYPFACPPALL